MLYCLPTIVRQKSHEGQSRDREIPKKAQITTTDFVDATSATGSFSDE